MSERSRRRLSNGAQTQVQQQQTKTEDMAAEPRSQSQMLNMKPGLQVNGRDGAGSNNSLLNMVPGPVKTRTGNAHRERSEDFALR